MPTVTAVAADNAPRDPGFERTDLRHQFLRATASTSDDWSGPFMIMEDMGEREFAVATTTPLGDRLNEYGCVLLDRWNQDHPVPAAGSDEP